MILMRRITTDFIGEDQSNLRDPWSIPWQSQGL
jgi:hypothetical protein